MQNSNKKDKKILLAVADGPEHIKIYTSDDQGVVDWSNTFPAVYLSASIQGSSFQIGPFHLSKIYEQLLEQLK